MAFFNEIFLVNNNLLGKCILKLLYTASPPRSTKERHKKKKTFPGIIKMYENAYQRVRKEFGAVWGGGFATHPISFSVFVLGPKKYIPE